jgi:hypothetical protein
MILLAKFNLIPNPSPCRRRGFKTLSRKAETAYREGRVRLNFQSASNFIKSLMQPFFHADVEVIGASYVGTTKLPVLSIHVKPLIFSICVTFCLY